MPELPEVEATRRSFADAIAGARILSVSLGKPLRWPLGCAPQDLVGRRVLQVRRRGKYLLLELSQGLLLLHLGMSGSLRFAPQAPGLPAAGAHDHFDLVTSQGTLRLHDPRRFGAVVAVSGEDDPRARKLLDGLGMEPLDPTSFTWARFAAGLQARRAPIKTVLLAGKLVVGVGNIYASEVLFLSRIHPATPACDISAVKARRLFTAIGQVMAQAVELGGTTLRDFSNALGVNGHFQHAAQVYGRAGQACHACSQPIQLLRQGQRSSYYCPRCQKTP